MNEGIKERISALVDGELSEFEVRRVLEEIELDPKLKEYWSKLQVSRDSLKDQSFSYLNNDISERVAAELGESLKEESNSEKLVTNKMLYLVSSVTAGMVLIVASVFLLPFGSDLTSEELFASQASEKIAKAIASPEALTVLGRSVTGMNATLEGLNSDKKGQIYANYKMPSNGKTFRVSLSLLSASPLELGNSNSSKLAYLKTKEGVILISVSGNISSEKKTQILRNANFSPNKSK